MATELAPELSTPAPVRSFFAKTATPLEWRLVAAAVRHVLDDEPATFFAEPDGLKFGAMSKSHMGEVLVEWPKAAFHRYECAGKVAMSVNVDQFVKVMARAGSADAVELSVAPGTGMLRVSFRGESASKEYELHLVGDAAYPRVPANVLDSSFSVEAGTLDSALEDIAVLSDSFEMLATTEFLRFRGTGDAGNARTDLPRGDPGLKSYDPGKEARAVYSVEQILPLVKALKASPKLEVGFSTNRPVRLKFSLNDKGANVVYWSAPRIVHDQDEKKSGEAAAAEPAAGDGPA